MLGGFNLLDRNVFLRLRSDIFRSRPLADFSIRTKLKQSEEPLPAAVSDPTQENRIRLLLLDDQALFRASLGRYLASQTGLEVAAECGSPADGLEILETSPVDVVLLASVPAEGFMSAARRAGYRGRFLIVADLADANASALSIKLGASGIFLKSEEPDRLVQAIRLVAEGATWLDQRIIQSLADQLIEGRSLRAPHSLLSDREQKVLLGILGGHTNKKIGDSIGLSEGSVKALLQQLFHRTGVRTRTQLVRLALEGALGSVSGLKRQNHPPVAPHVAALHPPHG